MRGAVWVDRLTVALLTVAFAALLPAHHHAAHDTHVAHAAHHADHADHQERDTDLALAQNGAVPRDNHADHHDDPAEAPPGRDERHQHGGHDCQFCHAARTLYTPVGLILPALALEQVSVLLPEAPAQIARVHITAVRQSRAPPAHL